MISRVARLLCLHCSWFAVMHVAWACGWRWGVPAGMKPISDRPFFLAYDIVVGLGLVALAVYSWRLATRPAMWTSRRAGVLMAAVAVVCGLRGGIGAAGDVVAVMQHESLSSLTVVADIWFVTATCMAVVLWRALTRSHAAL